MGGPRPGPESEATMKRVILILSILAIAGSSVALARGGRHHHPGGLLDAATGLQIATDRLEDALQAQVRHGGYWARERAALRETRQLEREARRFRHYLRHERRPSSYEMARRFERLRDDYRSAMAALYDIRKTPWVARQTRLVRAHFLETRERVSLRLAGRYAVPRGRYERHHEPSFGPIVFGSLGIRFSIGDDD
jgi:hypothetical protein